MDRLTWQEIRVSTESKYCNISDTVIVNFSYGDFYNRICTKT